MARRHDEEAVLVEEGLGDQLGVGDGQGEHRHVDGARVELELQGRGGGVVHDDPHPRVALGHGLDQRRHQPAGGRADQPDAAHAGDLVAHRGHVGGEGVELGLDATGPLDHDRPLLGDLAGGPVDEGHAELLLQAGDVGRHVGLHGVQGAGGGGEAAVVDHGEHGVELAQVHRWS